jgi:hypothetical protein
LGEKQRTRVGLLAFEALFWFRGEGSGVSRLTLTPEK